jgi:hypothetical protein
MTESSSNAAKRALLFGINTYPRMAQRYQLDGCVNDVTLMAGILRDNFGFPEDNITVLADEEATRDGILGAIDALTESTRENDIVVIHYSGHGSRIRDREGDEADGWDETIVPHDSGRGDHENRDVTDDEIYVKLAALTEKTSFVTLIFDCCHSGTVTRDAFGAKDRRVPDDERPIAALPPSPLSEDQVRVAREVGRDIGPSAWLPLGERYVLIAGCRDEESSYEHTAWQNGSEVMQGALTYFLGQELVTAETGATYRDVFERASAQVTAAHSRQHPQMEGTRDRELFGVRDIEPMRFVYVKGRTGDQVTLSAGAAHGLSVGSRWAVYPQAIKQITDETPPVGLVHITEVRATTSDAKIAQEEEDGAIAPDTRAVEEEHVYGDPLLAVDIKAPPDYGGAAAELATRIDESKLLRRAEEGDKADVRAYVIPKRTETSEDDPVPQLKVVEVPTWAVVEDGILIMAPRSVADGDATSKLVANLEKKARYRNALALKNPNPNSVLKNRIDFVLKRQKRDGTWERVSDDETNVFEDEDRIAFEIRNRHTAPVYVSVLDFGLTYGISLLHPPNRPSEKFEPSDAPTKVGERETIELWIPPEFQQDEGTETFKLFATTHEVDFSWLAQEGTRSIDQKRGTKGHGTPLQELFELAYEGGTRDARPVTVSADEEWTTVERRFTVRKRML